MNFLHHVKVIVACRTVRAKRNIEPRLLHFRDRCEAAAKLKIACWAVDNGNAFFPQDFHIAVRQPDTMGCRGGRVKNTEVAEPGRRCFAVPFDTFLLFLLCFGKMEVHPAAKRVAVRRVAAHNALGAGVFCMDGKINSDSPIGSTVVGMKQLN